MMPHRHVEEVLKSHSHKHDHQDHEDKSQKDHSSPLGKVDHSAEFGEALIKPGDSKYQIAQVKFMPLMRIACGADIVRLNYKSIPKLSLQHGDHLIAPALYLQGIGFRGPPSC